jgi:indole-3-glycerol phosphate synthase
MAARSGARVIGAKRRESEAALAHRAFTTPAPRLLRLDSGGFDVIAEIKRRSPASGELVEGLDGVGPRAAAYVAGGAAMLSVLTEPSAFRGSLADVADAARAVPVPVMRKDFLVDPYQVLQARVAGAGAVLLVLRILDDTRLVAMLDTAAQARLAVLLEAFDERDLDRCGAVAALAEHLGVTFLVGVNARDLTTLEVDPSRHERLAGRLPFGVPAVAESGIHSADDVRRLAALGYRAVLVGSALMRAPDPAVLVREMVRAGREARRASA